MCIPSLELCNSIAPVQSLVATIKTVPDRLKRLVFKAVCAVFENCLCPLIFYPLRKMKAYRAWCKMGHVVAPPMRYVTYPKAEESQFTAERYRPLLDLIKECQPKLPENYQTDFWKATSSNLWRGTCYGQSSSVMIAAKRAFQDSSQDVSKAPSWKEIIASASVANELFFQILESTKYHCLHGDYKEALSSYELQQSLIKEIAEQQNKKIEAELMALQARQQEEIAKETARQAKSSGWSKKFDELNAMLLKQEGSLVRRSSTKLLDSAELFAKLHKLLSEPGAFSLRISLDYDSDKKPVDGHTIACYLGPTPAIFDSQLGVCEYGNSGDLIADLVRYVEANKIVEKTPLSAITLELFV